MKTLFVRVAAIVLVSTALLNCAGSTEPRNTNLDAARSVWLTQHPENYTFEVATASFATSNSGYYRISVSNGQVVEATDPAGKPVANFTLTIDALWDSVLGARERGELNSAFFDARGVPVEVDMGDWALDSGVHYSVRSFTAGH